MTSRADIRIALKKRKAIHSQLARELGKPDRWTVEASPKREAHVRRWWIEDVRGAT